jgi:hypothetical protein
MAFLHLKNLVFPSILVNTLTTCRLLIWWTHDLRAFDQITKCLVPKFVSLKILMQLLFSQNSGTLLFPRIPNLISSFWSHMTSFIAPIGVLYLNSINDNAMDCYFLLFHVKGMEPNLKFKPSIDFLSSKLLPECAFVKLVYWNFKCRNLSLGAHDQGKGLQRCGPRMSLRITFHAPRSAKECEGMNFTFPNELSHWELES